MKTKKRFTVLIVLFSLLSQVAGVSVAIPSSASSENPAIEKNEKRITQEERQAAADRMAAKRAITKSLGAQTLKKAVGLDPNAIPDYFGIANWANSPLPTTNPNGSVVPGTGIRKFIDTLAGLGQTKANNLGQYIPVAIPDTTTFPGSDYYEIELTQFTEKMHTDLPATTIRGYRQVNTSNPAVSAPHYLGPAISAHKDKPVRIKFKNSLPIGTGGDLFLPVDTTVMGAGMGPLDMPGMPGMKENYTQNRATLHLHGGLVPWISDGTPHQWTTPAQETTQYPKGVSVQYVPDMWFDATGNPVPAGTAGASNNPGDGSMTFYYNNQQSARLMFYHDHSYGITRLNVYAGEAAPYIIDDPTEQALVSQGILPQEQIPLVIQDKTFVPDDNQLASTDPTWNKAKWGGKGNFWYPHVYMPNQNPADIGGMNAFGRWHYGPWFWPPTSNIANGPVANPYYQPNPTLPNYAPWEPAQMPGTPTPSMAMEAFMDTPTVNGTAYPVLNVDPKSYRFRVLNAADDRFLNLQLYKADPTVSTPDGRMNTEVKMVTAPDGREGGVPDPATAGPSMIQIANEGGFLPNPVVLPNQPIDWNKDQTKFNFGNVTSHTLLLGTAERADVVIDFSQYAGQTLILYNDSPAPFPALDPRYDYHTGGPDLTATGGAPTTLPGYGPNTRTIMQIRVGSDYITSLYQNILGRDPDQGGWTHFQNALNSGVGRRIIVNEFYASREYIIKYIQSQYQAILGRPADPAGLNFWTGLMLQGFSERNLRTEFYASLEYQLAHPGSQYVISLYQNILGRTPTQNEVNAWLDVLSWQPNRRIIVNTFIANSVYFGIFLEQQYQAILGRAVDPLGLNYWTSLMLAGLSERNIKIELYVSQEYLLRVSPPPAAQYNLAALQTKFVSTPGTPGVFESSQDPILMPNSNYNSAYNKTFPADPYVRIHESTKTFSTISGASVTVPFQAKAIQDEMGEAYDEYGRQSGFLGLQKQAPVAPGAQTFNLYPYATPPVDVVVDNITPSEPIAGDGTQIWKITHNGVDTHPIHFHLFNVQLINRVAWDNTVILPDPNELGWKETIRVNPLEDTIVAMRPIAPTQPFEVPNSVRVLDPTMPNDAVLAGGPGGFFDPLGNPVASVLNQLTNFGWEYVYHCHILAHEEMDMMHPLVFAAAPKAPTNLQASGPGGSVNLSWTDNSLSETGFTVQWADNPAGPWTVLTDTLPIAVGTGTTVNYTDTTAFAGIRYYRVFAKNTVGSTLPNFPTATANSLFSNTANN